MPTNTIISKTLGEIYIRKLSNIFNDSIYKKIDNLAMDLRTAWINQKNIFICGNGGSGVNAIHMANDLLYGAGSCGNPPQIPGLKVDALTSNQGILTCLSNDIGYENIFSHQLQVKGQKDDLLIVLSGSGNSPNVLNAIDISRKIGIKTFAILGFDGGQCLNKSDCAIHFPINDMQIAEDTQLIIGHICMQWLSKNKPLHMDPLQK